VSRTEKKKRADKLMAVQEEISFGMNLKKVGKIFKVLIDKKEGDYFIGRTEYDSPEVDNEVLIPAESNYLKIGDFAKIKIVEAMPFDLIGKPITE
jgi:ribosomal protein S12 methylthiotransferase